jgi:hypothetical protein
MFVPRSQAIAGFAARGRVRVRVHRGAFLRRFDATH